MMAKIFLCTNTKYVLPVLYKKASVSVQIKDVQINLVQITNQAEGVSLSKVSVCSLIY